MRLSEHGIGIRVRMMHAQVLVEPACLLAGRLPGKLAGCIPFGCLGLVPGTLAALKQEQYGEQCVQCRQRT